MGGERGGDQGGDSEGVREIVAPEGEGEGGACSQELDPIAGTLTLDAIKPLSPRHTAPDQVALSVGDLTLDATVSALPGLPKHPLGWNEVRRLEIFRDLLARDMANFLKTNSDGTIARDARGCLNEIELENGTVHINPGIVCVNSVVHATTGQNLDIETA